MALELVPVEPHTIILAMDNMPPTFTLHFPLDR